MQCIRDSLDKLNLLAEEMVVQTLYKKKRSELFAIPHNNIVKEDCHRKQTVNVVIRVSIGSQEMLVSMKKELPEIDQPWHW